MEVIFEMRRSNYTPLPVEIRGNLLATRVYDTKAHWLLLALRQMWSQFAVSAFPKRSALSDHDLLFAVPSPWSCLQNLHLYFSGHLLANLPSV